MKKPRKAYFQKKREQVTESNLRQHSPDVKEFKAEPLEALTALGSSLDEEVLIAVD